MNFKLDWVYERLRVCAKCGSGFWRKPEPMDLFCSICWKATLRWMNQVGELQQEPPPTLGTYKFEIWSLFSWSLLNDADLRPLVYALKGGGLETVFADLAGHFSFERGLERSQLRGGDAVLIVPPRKPGTQRDHAWQWAQALAQIWEVPVWDGLAYADFGADAATGSQKHRSLRDRRQQEFVAIKSFPKQKHIIFVDDIITSGSTMLAVWKALLGPPHFQAWTLASRPKLAGF